MGTFIMKPVTVSFNTGWSSRIDNVLQPDPATDENLIDSVTTGDLFGNHTYIYNNVVGPISIRYGFIGLSVYLDGSLTPIDTNNLPVDFAVIDCDAIWRVEAFAVGVGDLDLYVDGFLEITVDGSISGSAYYTHNLGAITNLSLIGKTMQATLTGAVSNAFRINPFTIEGTYSGTPFVYTISPPGGSDVEPGQTITVSGPNPSPTTVGGLVEPDRVIPIPKKDDEFPVPLPPTEECEECLADCPECDTCYDACLEDFESENCQECIENCLGCLEDCLEDLEEAEKCQQSQQDDPPTEVVIVICDPTGTQFTGSVPLGTLTILVARASGIYKLVDGKTNDTLYATARDGTTYDVAIPTPFAKTGFFRS